MAESSGLPKFSIGLGLCADYGLLCESFIPKFDFSDHVIARSVVELREFSETTDAVFSNGLWLVSPEAPERQA